ncbi:MAG: hypothetical protein IVW54_02260 [Candidatus Binataceae bacterium]|nr:hypothetical protein [Candidatus Binataceae bacterium]
MTEKTLPAEFKDLEPFAADWVFPTQKRRRMKRLSSNMDAIGAFYSVILPRIEAVARHLGPRPLDQLAPEEQRLLWMAYMFMEVAPAVEIFGQPEVRGNTFPYARFFEANPITGGAIVDDDN